MAGEENATWLNRKHKRLGEYFGYAIAAILLLGLVGWSSRWVDGVLGFLVAGLFKELVALIIVATVLQKVPALRKAEIAAAMFVACSVLIWYYVHRAT